MKTQDTNFFQALGKEQLNNLVKEVKETVAVDVQMNHGKSAFGAVDYWNLQRMRKTRIVRRHLVA
jgi:protein-arginine kinase